VRILRAEIGVASRSSVDTAVQSASTMVSALREETRTTIDQRFATIRTTTTAPTTVITPIIR